ncbi:glycosyltransferase family 2 protein [Candidatus Gottesmanbacteria bacterium]|nr:glycosyltransferase family 2 protein [Candidatus Gottesmanbacteria bacterium]
MDLSVIIVSYNVKELLKNCLESILKYTQNLKYEIIVVDNASTDNSVSYLRSLSNLKLILSKENGGFSKGNNLGIKEAKGKYILLLNPDTLLVENSLKIIFDWMEARPKIAVASCQLLNSEQKITPTGGYFPNLSRLIMWAFFIDHFIPIKSYHSHASFWPQSRISKNAGDAGAAQHDTELDWITGAFFMIRKETLDRVGLLDENIFMYGEELEWCLRFKQNGFKVGYAPVTKIIHLAKSLPRNAVLGEFKGLKYIYEKHFFGWRQTVLEFLLNIAAVLRIIMWLVRLKPVMAKIYLEALFL